MKQGLGIKSIKFAVLELIGTAIFIPFAVIFLLNKTENDFLSNLIPWIFGACGLYTLYLATSTLVLPKVVISYDENGIYLEHKKKFIPYEKIISVMAKETRAKRHTYSFGHVIIKTTHASYKVGVINNVVMVSQEIMIEKHKKAERMFE